jgi:hypothetical protein
MTAHAKHLAFPVRCLRDRAHGRWRRAESAQVEPPNTPIQRNVWGRVTWVERSRHPATESKVREGGLV